MSACPIDTGPVFLTRYRDVKQIFNDPRFKIYKPLTIGNETQHLRTGEEGSARSHRISPLLPILTQHLSARAVQHLAPLIEIFVHACLEKALERGCMDIMADLAYPLPIAMMAELMGLPPEEILKLKKSFAALSRGHDLGATTQDKQHGHLALLTIGRWLGPLLRQCRPTPLMDAIMTVARTKNVGETTLNYWCTMLLYAGSATTKGALSNAIGTLLQNPERVRLLIDQPEHIESAVEEFLRIQGPVRGVARVAAEDVTLGDQTIRRGQLVYLMLDQANRDAERFEAADHVDLCRSPNPHLAFGYGGTHCLGAHLARLEICETLRAVLPYLPRMSIGGDAVRSDYRLLCEYAALPVIIS